MADKKISELTEKTNTKNTDEIVIVDNDGTPETKKVTRQNFFKGESITDFGYGINGYVYAHGYVLPLTEIIQWGDGDGQSYLWIDGYPEQKVYFTFYSTTQEAEPVLDFSGITGSKVFTLPNKDGQIAVIEQGAGQGLDLVNQKLIMSGGEIATNETQFDIMLSGTDHALIDLSEIINGDDRTFKLPDKDGTFAMLDSDYLIRRIATIENVDFKSVGDTVIYTVPTGKKFVLTDIVFRTKTSTAPNGYGTFSIKRGSDDWDFTSANSGFIPAVGWYKSALIEAVIVTEAPIVSATDTIEIEITTGDTGTALNCDIDLFGYLV